MTRAHKLVAIICVLSATLVLGRVANAQTTNLNNTTATPVPGSNRDYIKMLSETVDPASGSVSIRVKVPVPPGRGLTVPFSFAYDSGSFTYPIPGSPGNPQWYLSSNTGFTQYLGRGAWGYSVPQLTYSFFHQNHTQGSQEWTCGFTTGYIFQDSSGARHLLPLGTANTSNNEFQCGSDYNSGSEPFYSGAFSTATEIADADGTVYSFSGPFFQTGLGTEVEIPSTIEDRNGNKVTLTNGSASGSFTETDTAGRAAVVSSGFGMSGNTITLAGLASPYTATWGTATVNFTVASTPSSPPAGCKVLPTASGSDSVITGIELPNGQSYSFTYDSTYGMVDKVTYPSGGYVTYSWGLNTQSAVFSYAGGNEGEVCTFVYDKPAILHRYVSFDGSALALQQDFAYSTTWSSDPGTDGWTSKQTTVTTHDLVRGTSFQTVYTYTPFLPPQAPYSDLVINYNDLQLPQEFTVAYDDFNGATIETVRKTWHDQYVVATQKTTLGTLSPTSEVAFSYGPGDQVTEKDEYDFGATSPTRRIVTTYQTFSPTPIFTSGPSIFDRPTSVVTYNSSGRVAETDYSYDQFSVGPATVTQHDNTNYGVSSTVRGNATTKTEQCVQGCSTNPVTTYHFDETGHVTSMTDPCGNAACADVVGTQHTTTYLYADSYTACSGSAPPSGNTNAYLTQITDPLGHTQKFCYGYTDGQLRGATDQNSQMITYGYADSLGRLTQINHPDGGLITYAYSDAPPAPTVTKKTLLKTGFVHTYVTNVNTMDGMGHLTQTQLTSDPDGTDTTITAYDGSGRTRSVTNPYRTSRDSTYGTTGYTYDALGRVTIVTNPGDSVTSAVTSSYSGNCTTTTDEAGISRQSCSDGLGRLTSVTENPGGLGYVTNYQYDVLDDLTSVVQNGSRQRTFTYNSLPQLISSTNPESNTAPSTQTTVPTTYNYDPNGNLTSKTVPAQDQQSTATVTLFYCYDANNRITSKAYTSQSCPMSAPIAAYSYDNSACLGQSTCFNVNRRTGMTDAAGSESWAYDDMGRTLVNQRRTNGITKGTTYTYSPYVEGSINSITYPSGNVITYTTGAAERPLSAIDSTINYATGAHYVASGALSAVENGGVLNSTYIYNFRLQPCWTYTTSSTPLATTSGCTASDSTPGNILDLKYSFPTPFAGGNNGDVIGITNNRDTTRSQSFTYDALNRISVAETTSTHATSPTSCWGESYGYDAWGNLLTIASPSSSYSGCTVEGTLSLTANAQNQIVGDTYDSSGNMLSPALSGATYSYNAENQMTQAATSAGVTGYVYDGDGKRIEKVGGGTVTKIYWYGSRTNALEETDGTGNSTNSSFYEYIFLGGNRIARRDSSGNVLYYFTDHLGTSRSIATILSGQSSATLCYDADFYPFGGERAYANNCAQNYKFTGKERDAESDLDNFAARFSGSNFGRFMSPDPDNLGAAVEAPQSWNGYSYVLNSPLNAVDPSGTDCIYIDNDTGKYLGFDRGDCDNSTDEKANTGYYVDGTVSTITTTTGDTNGVVTAYSATNYDTASPTLLSGTFGPAPGNGSAPTTMPKPLAGAVAGPVIVCELAEPCGAVLDTIVIGAAAITGAVLVGKGAYNYLSKGGTQNIVPSWAEGERPLPGESGRDFAKRVCDARYGPGNYPTGPGSEYNKLKKWGNDNRS